MPHLGREWIRISVGVGGGSGTCGVGIRSFLLPIHFQELFWKNVYQSLEGGLQCWKRVSPLKTNAWETIFRMSINTPLIYVSQSNLFEALKCKEKTHPLFSQHLSFQLIGTIRPKLSVGCCHMSVFMLLNIFWHAVWSGLGLAVCLEWKNVV